MRQGLIRQCFNQQPREYSTALEIFRRRAPTDKSPRTATVSASFHSVPRQAAVRSALPVACGAPSDLQPQEPDSALRGSRAPQRFPTSGANAPSAVRAHDNQVSADRLRLVDDPFERRAMSDPGADGNTERLQSPGSRRQSRARVRIQLRPVSPAGRGRTFPTRRP